MPSKKISIIIPVYFNQDSLHPLFKKIIFVERLLNKKNLSLELIFVDDGSLDKSLNCLLDIKKIRPKTIIIKLTKNFGAVHASKAGLSYVSGDAFSILAADLQDPPELLLQMVDLWESGSKFVICERQNRNDPLITKIFSHAYYKLIRIFVLPEYPKGGYDLALMDKELLPHLINSSKNVFTPLLAFWLGYKPSVIKYERLLRKHGKSKWTLSKKVKAFLDVMLGFSITPIRAISGIGFLVSIVSLIYGISVFYSALFNSIPIKGFATIVTLITFLLGIIIFMLGIIGEYLWRIFDEINKRPETVIEKIWK